MRHSGSSASIAQWPKWCLGIASATMPLQIECRDTWRMWGNHHWVINGVIVILCHLGLCFILSLSLCHIMSYRGFTDVSTGSTLVLTIKSSLSETFRIICFHSPVAKVVPGHRIGHHATPDRVPRHLEDVGKPPLGY